MIYIKASCSDDTVEPHYLAIPMTPALAEYLLRLLRYFYDIYDRDDNVMSVSLRCDVATWFINDSDEEFWEELDSTSGQWIEGPERLPLGTYVSKVDLNRVEISEDGVLFAANILPDRHPRGIELATLQSEVYMSKEELEGYKS